MQDGEDQSSQERHLLVRQLQLLVSGQAVVTEWKRGSALVDATAAAVQDVQTQLRAMDRVRRR